MKTFKCIAPLHFSLEGRLSAEQWQLARPQRPMKTQMVCHCLRIVYTFHIYVAENAKNYSLEFLKELHSDQNFEHRCKHS